MPSRIQYLFDSDVLIASARLHYSPAYCQVFWDWLTDGHKSEIFFSIDKVKGELLDGQKDPLNAWANSSDMDDFFLPSLSALVQWQKITTYAVNPAKQFTEAAKEKFLNGDKADAWLIAYAAQHGNFVIVTNEVSAKHSKKEIKLPDAAEEFGIKTVKLFDIMQLHAGHNFSLKSLLPVSVNH
jgi:hypothetical protein